jgi:hypothetical protein
VAEANGRTAEVRMCGEMGGSASRVVGKRDGQGRVADRPFGGICQAPGPWDTVGRTQIISRGAFPLLHVWLAVFFFLLFLVLNVFASDFTMVWLQTLRHKAIHCCEVSRASRFLR